MPSKNCQSCLKHRPIFGGSGLCHSCFAEAVGRGEIAAELPDRCSVDDCDSWAAKSGMCDKHYRRFVDHGTTDKVRREGQHREYKNWWWLKAHGKLCIDWMDFDTFVSAIGERPSDRHWLERHDENEPFGPQNFFWRAPKLDEEHSFSTPEGRLAYERAVAKAEPGRFVGQSLKAYGLTTGDYEEMLKAQGGVCAACGQRETDIDSRNGQVKLFVVDHNHTTGTVRGLLCGGCNKAVGFANDDPVRLERLAAYIRRTAQLPDRFPIISTDVCNVPDCHEDVYALGFCSRHYQQNRKGAEIDTGKVCLHCEKPLQDRLSTTKFCDLSCKSAWHRKNGAYAEEARLKSRGVCSIEGCGKAIQAYGYCSSHAARHWKYGDANFVPPKAPKKPCTEPDCTEPTVAKGLCSKHYYASRKKCAGASDPPLGGNE